MSFDPAAPSWNFFELDKIPLKKVDDYIEEYENRDFWQNYMQQYFGMVKC
eukprot:CAMPEP_0197252396 /NCGR_PEP_ID=MMETSP1429-20130617/61204_1 /TAXON_ID=49237 /ORGANISM="Chaetoceros  sp., Strain UNC1202" /LENGTH=49 /DNA_ID= /DNA_START= /DNA_END= /DNA_ORIENTATION=